MITGFIAFTGPEAARLRLNNLNQRKKTKLLQSKRAENNRREKSATLKAHGQAYRMPGIGVAAIKIDEVTLMRP